MPPSVFCRAVSDSAGTLRRAVSDLLRPSATGNSEQCRGRSVGPSEFCRPMSMDGTACTVSAREREQYFQWRQHFVVHMVRRQSKHPAYFTKLFQDLGIDDVEVDVSDCFRRVVEDHLDFSKYLSLNVAAGIRDSIQIHGKTWVAMLSLFGIFAVLHRFARWTLYHLMPGFVVVAVLILAVMHVVVLRQKRKLRRRMQVEENPAVTFAAHEVLGVSRSSAIYVKASVEDSLERFPMEIVVLRMLQIMLFCISYIMARDVLDFKDWRTNFKQTLAFACLFLTVCTTLAWVLPSAVPVFLGHMAMPPYVDDDNFRVFCELLLQEKQAREVKLVRTLTRSQRTVWMEPSFSNISMLLNSPGPSLYQSQVSTGLSCGQMTYGSRQPTFDCAASTRQSSKEREARSQSSLRVQSSSASLEEATLDRRVPRQPCASAAGDFNVQSV